MILCNCCNTDNAPMARHKDYWICDDCVQKYGSYDAAFLRIIEKKVSAGTITPNKALEKMGFKQIGRQEHEK